MPSEGSVTRWLGQLRAGDAAAAQPLWERYVRRLVGLARKKLHGRPSRAADGEDVALSAFDSFCRNAEQGRFPQLADRDKVIRDCHGHSVRLGEDIFFQPFFKSSADQGDQQKTPNPKNNEFEPFEHGPTIR